MTINLPLKLNQINPGTLDLIKLFALLAMILDHANTLFLKPQIPELYSLGRIAFPLFTLIWAINVNKNPARLQKRANRLWAWSILTQPIFTMTFIEQYPVYSMNILFVFAGVTQLLALRAKFGVKGTFAGVLLLLLMLVPLTPASYGVQGIVLATSLAAYFSYGQRYLKYALICIAASLLTLNGIIYIGSRPADVILLAILPTVLLSALTITVAQHLSSFTPERFMPGGFFYWAYSGHLLILCILAKCL
ncbi:TraX family protein [Pectobacterium versatile]|uniref:TraX family protein n=2 Tax=Pectobacterium versatile TaxID=2488639 RepID=UPI002B24C964|nr:TraX family protein [Pectobacterium versatile]